VSLSSLRALVVSVSGRTLLVPLDTIVATARLEPGALLALSDGRALVHEGVTLPFRALSSWLHPERDVSLGRVTVVVRTHRGNVAIGVDALRGTRDVIVRPLPRAAGASELIAGVALDGLGDPELVLDPEGLLGVPAAREKAKPEGSTRKKPVLVIDDSLTTRMLEQSILDAAGYDVDVASSAEEGLQKALARAYGLIVCDVEMPGMNGYEFTAETRKRESLRKIPVIMVTSLASEESRRRGREAGVSAYIVKGEFDQGRFLRTVGELLP
jgi:two-component system chemotaxis sensor kinase CheA